MEIKLDLNGVDQSLKQLLADDLPFTIARFLTFAAQAGQEAARKEEGRVFNIRNDWTQRNTKITPATKQSLVSEVYTDTTNRRTGAPDYLPLQEDGGEKVSVGKRQLLAIPTEYLRRMAGGKDKIIPDWLRPGAMLQYADTGGKYTSRRGKVRTQPAAIRGMYFFLVPFKSGAKGILARYVTDPRNQAYPMYIFVTRAHIRKRFAMQETVEETVIRTADANFDRAAAEVLVNNALASGLRVRF